MSQSSLILPTTGTLPGLTAVADINAANAALATMNSGGAAPASTLFGGTGSVPAGVFWLNTSTNPYAIEISDGVEFVTFGYLDPTLHLFTVAGATGTVLFFPGHNANLPPGCVLCYGQLLSIASYPNLFAKLGTIYGGNGTSTFGMPDLRGTVLAGLDNMGGAAAGNLTGYTAIGQTGGNQTQTLTISQMPSHTHIDSGHTHTGTASDAGHTHQWSMTNTTAKGGTDVAAYIPASGISGSTVNYTTSGNASITVAINSATANLSSIGGGASHNIVQPTMVCNIALWV